MITVIETSQFIGKARKLKVSDAKRAEIIETVAANPGAGDVMPRTGGVRKLRVASEAKGKSGGYRVIYYFYDEENPLLLFDIYGKGEKATLTKDEEKQLYGIIQTLKKELKK